MCHSQLSQTNSCLLLPKHIWANCNCFKRTYIFWANCNDFKGITHTLSQVQLFQAKHHILRKRNYFKWNMHILSQLQLFQVQHALSQLLTTFSTKICIVRANYNCSNWKLIFWANCIHFILNEICIFWTNGNYSNWNRNSLNYLQLIHLNYASSETVANISSKICILEVGFNCNDLNWNMQSLYQSQLSLLKHA